MKEKIQVAYKKMCEEKGKESKKMRFLQRRGVDTYINEVYNDDVRIAMKVRLNMVEWIDENYGQSSGCIMCGEADTTEHVFHCGGVRNEEKVTVKDLEKGERMKDIVKLFKRSEEKRREKLVNDITTNFEIFQREGTI